MIKKIDCRPDDTVYCYEGKKSLKGLDFSSVTIEMCFHKRVNDHLHVRYLLCLLSTRFAPFNIQSSAFYVPKTSYCLRMLVPPGL